MKKSTIAIFLSMAIALVVALGSSACSTISQPEAGPPSFDGQRAYEDVKTQVSFGPRSPGTPGHDQIRAWIQKELEAAGCAI